jgi:hypothetical protein
MNPGVRLHGQVAVQTPTPPATTMMSAKRPKRTLLERGVFRVGDVSVISNVSAQGQTRRRILDQMSV